MSALARIHQLARQQRAQQNAPLNRAQKKLDLSRTVKQENLRDISPSLWDELASHLDHNPSLGLALARVLHAIAKRRRNARVRATADLALIRALNVCGEFKQAIALCEDAARRFEKLGDVNAVARVWLEAAWAETYLGDLKAVEAYLKQAYGAFYRGGKNPDLELRVQWIRARILRERGEFKNALYQFETLRAQLFPVRNILDAARVLREIGHTYTRLHPSDAQQLLRQALAIFQSVRCPIEIALVNYLMGQVKTDLGLFDRAHFKLITAQRIFRQHKLHFFNAICDLEIGFLECERERFAESLEYSKRAHIALTKLEARQELSSCEVNLGWALMRLNRYSEALGYLKHAAQRALDTGRQTKAALCFSNIGWIMEKQGHYAQALENHQRARDIFAREKMIERLVGSDLDLGQLYAQLGDFHQALSVLARARRVCQREGMMASLAECELYRAQILFQQHKFALARRALYLARRLFAKNQQTTSAAFCERLLARLESKQRRAARAYLASSRKIFSANKLVVDVALCDMTRAELALEWGEWRAAQHALQRAQRVLDPSFPDQVWRIAFGLGKVAQAEKQISSARRHYLRAAHALARLRGNLQLEELSNGVFGARRYALDRALAFMEHHNLAHDALTVLETAKAQTFVHALAVRAARVPTREHEQGRALRAKEQTLRHALDAARAKLVTVPVATSNELTRSGELGTHSPAESLAQLAKLERAYERVASQQRLTRQGLTSAPTLEPFDLAALRGAADQQWGDDWNALDYYFANGRLYILWVTRDDVQLSVTRWTLYDQRMLEECAATHPDLREVVYRHTLRGIPVNTMAHTALEYLAKRLIPAPLLERKRAQTLLVAPHGLLHQLPIHALRVQDTPLLERFTLLYTPNLQAFTQLATAREKEKRARWLLYGASDFGERAAPLQHTRRELDALETLAQARTTVCWQETATRTQLLEWNRTHALQQYEVLHFATHAVIESRAPHTSRILLADQDLSVLDVMELNLNARLVTLSGCSSAVGKGGSGDEWLGLTRAFFYAGARAIVASLWAVEDESTAQLMKFFYRNMLKGENIAQALRHAQLTLRANGYSDYHWAPFVAIGDV